MAKLRPKAEGEGANLDRGLVPYHGKYNCPGEGLRARVLFQGLVPYSRIEFIARKVAHFS